MGRLRRAVFFVGWLLKSLFFKLSPARRLLLVLAFVGMWSSITIERNGGTTGVVVGFPLVTIGALLLIVALELKDKLVAHYELEAGRAVQRALMPEANPIISGWEVWLFTRSANHVGGDLVDCVPIDDRRFGIVLGDVAGKGLPAALLMAKLQATVRALASESPSLATLGEQTNRILCRDGLSNRFATMVYVNVTANSGSVAVLNAGHPPPLVLRNGRVEELPRGAIAMGILPDARFFETPVELGDGDALVIFSDGVTEAMNVSDEFFGDERLRGRLLGLGGMDASGIGTEVVADVDEFVGDTRPHDDLSLVVLRRTSAGGVYRR
jgi:sigma-B regulation protein RsbU (phosphoserine phosphatase)